MIADAELAMLTAGRWLVPLMAHVGGRAGRRASRRCWRGSAVAQRAGGEPDALQEAGWLARNPGHGHPLRPEYVLTRRASRSPPSARG